MERLDKLLAASGMTRSEARKLVSAGRVSVRGAVVKDAGAHCTADEVTLDGHPLVITTELTLMIHKPAGVVTATEDKRLPTVVDLLPEEQRLKKLGPVGRLDRDVTGLVLLTTDGELAHRLISPKRHADKCYRAVCEGRLTDEHIRAFASGMDLGDFTAKPAELTILRAGDETSEADVILREGKFHQVKRMFAAIGHPLVSLKRLRIGNVTLDERLAPGESRILTEEELDGLYRLVGMR